MTDGVKENELIKKVQSGDQNAINTLISSYYQAIFAYFYKNTGQYHQSKDLTQEVFIKMAAGISRYCLRAPFKSWLFTIASNHLKNYYRLCSRKPEPEELAEDIPAGRSEISKAEIRNDIREALAKLPPEQKEAVLLHFYHDFSFREIAKITETKEATVKSRIRYGLAKLKKELEGYEI